MSKYEKKGTITFSPTAITDKEEIHEIHKKSNNDNETIFWINVTSEDGATYTSDKTYDEVYEAFFTGKMCVAVYENAYFFPHYYSPTLNLIRFICPKANINHLLIFSNYGVTYTENVLAYENNVYLKTEVDTKISTLEARIAALEAAVQTTSK